MEAKMSHLKGEPVEETDGKTIPDSIRHWCQTKPNAAAFIFLHTDGTREVVTWREFHDQCVEYAKAFMTLGVKEKDVVAITGRSQPKWLYINFGLMFAGAVTIPLVFTYKDGSDVIAVLKGLGSCTTFVLDPENDETTWPIFKSFTKTFKKDGSILSDKIPSLKYLLCTTVPDNETEVLTLENLLQIRKAEQILPAVDPNTVAALFQTSGSTGIPKAAAHTHRSLYYMFSTFFSLYGTSYKDNTFFNDRPFNWLGGWPVNVVSGETRVCRSGLSPPPKDGVDFIIRSVQQERCTVMLLLPPMLHDLIDRTASDAVNDWPVRTIITGSQPISKNLAACLDRLCSKFMCVYAGTEFFVATSNQISNKNDFTEYSCGAPVQGFEVKVVDDNGRTVPVNTRGEIYVRSVAMFDGYYNDNERTRSVFAPDGWYKTDDIGRITDEGHVYAEGRKSDVILSGGFNVPPAVLESLLKSCPGVKSVIAVPIPDDTFYQVICVCVIRESGSALTEDELRKYCEGLHNDRRQTFTVQPTYYLFYDRFPETRTGKVSRKELAAQSFQKISIFT